MRSWDLIQTGSKFFLDNGDETPIRKSRTCRIDIPALCQRMEDLGVPFAYTQGLLDVYLTRHLPGIHGDYIDGKMRLVASQPDLERTFIHELAHHVDDMVELTDDGLLSKERRTRGKHMVDPYAKHSDQEYLAVGFEVYYCGTVKERKKMRAKNPLLFSTIRRLHRRYKRQ